jgi:GTP-binding protein
MPPLFVFSRDLKGLMFIDEVVISVKAGDGGNGCLAFRREKFVPRGGPSGGDGGHGGDIEMVASTHYNTLLHFRFNPEHSAERGRHGEGSNRTGRDGKSIELPVPVGTIVFDASTGEQLADFTAPEQRYTVAHGGRGGRGNARFATSTHQAPTEHEEGKPGDLKKLRLELKLLADVGLVGFPNAGKSTLISRLSAARPKIADYPFTTLEPNLGVVEAGDKTFVMADIPGLIEGAHEGHGLGIQFLKHVERTKVLVHLVDASEFTGREAAHDFDVILDELRNFSEELAQKPMIVVASKVDACQDAGRIVEISDKAKSLDMPFLAVSSVTGAGIEELRFLLRDQLFKPERTELLPVATIENGS